MSSSSSRPSKKAKIDPAKLKDTKISHFFRGSRPESSDAEKDETGSSDSDVPMTGIVILICGNSWMM